MRRGTMDQANNFEYRGWQVHIEVTGGDAMFSGHADLSLNGGLNCRIVLATSRNDRAAARWALDSQARDYVDDWTSNLHTGTTDFSELGEE